MTKLFSAAFCAAIALSDGFAAHAVSILPGTRLASVLGTCAKGNAAYDHARLLKIFTELEQLCK